MKKTICVCALILGLLYACNDDETSNTTETSSTIRLQMEHTWDDAPITNTDFNTLKFTNANGETMSITKLRYLMSNVTFTKATGESITLEGYELIDVINNANLNTESLGRIPNGSYSNVAFTFGFNNADNYNNNYQDLNAVLWNVPDILGGGYHYMQLEGKFINNASAEQGYAYHAIRAVDNTGDAQKFQDTFFQVNLGAMDITNDTTLNVEMNVAEWFKTPNTWDLNLLNTMLMPNFNAQILMHQNGQNAFRLKGIK